MSPRPLLLVCALLGGCAATLKIDVKTRPDTNQKAPLYMLVRSVEPKAFGSESYTDVAAKLSEHDPSILKTQLLYPGRTYNLELKKPPKGAVALYFLFTAPGGSWRTLLEAPLPARVHTELDQNQIRSESQN